VNAGNLTGSHAARRRAAKAAEDRHIGFRWLKREARLASERDAEAVFRAVAGAFGHRVGRSETRHVAAHLPLGLRELWEEETRSSGAPRALERDEFVASVASRLQIEKGQAEVLVRIVFAWLKHLAPEEIADVSTILPPRLRELWNGAQAPYVPPWRALAIIRLLEPLPVRFIIVEPDRAEPVEEEEGEVFQLPVRGTRLWREGRAFIVARVVEDEHARVVLVRDRLREESVYDDLPAGSRIVASERPDGTWFARVDDSDGLLLAWSRDRDCDEAVDLAHSSAVHLLEVAGGYRPEREAR
jgi:uncharacterized protein (DUF2267 family)